MFYDLQHPTARWREAMDKADAQKARSTSRVVKAAAHFVASWNREQAKAEVVQLMREEAHNECDPAALIALSKFRKMLDTPTEAAERARRWAAIKAHAQKWMPTTWAEFAEMRRKGYTFTEIVRSRS
jgi:hypothetical protein